MRFVRPLAYTLIGFLTAVIVAPAGGGTIATFATGFAIGFIFGFTDD